VKILAYIIIAIGIVDLFGHYASSDLWGGFIKVELPNILWQYSAYIEIAIGFLVLKFSDRTADAEASEQDA